MAAGPSSSKDAAPTSSDTSVNDPSLDFYSDKFDPLKALLAANIKLPVPNAKTFDNLAMYEATQRRVGLPTEKKSEPAPKFERRFEPHQMPVPGYRKRVTKNVLTQMEKFDGPLSFLKICVDKRLRLKVWTRHSHGLRGYCLSFCVAFDKHWNLALEDVTEVWTRPKSRKVPALGSLTVPQTTRAVKREVVPPKITIKKTTKKLEYCERYVPQLLVRGEQIAFINIIE